MPLTVLRSPAYSTSTKSTWDRRSVGTTFTSSWSATTQRWNGLWRHWPSQLPLAATISQSDSHGDFNASSSLLLVSTSSALPRSALTLVCHYLPLVMTIPVMQGYGCPHHCPHCLSLGLKYTVKWRYDSLWAWLQCWKETWGYSYYPQSVLSNMLL